jgi:exonuclease VII small subunit
MTKLEKLRENLENNILELKEALNLFEKECKATYTKIDSQI